MMGLLYMPVSLVPAVHWWVGYTSAASIVGQPGYDLIWPRRQKLGLLVSCFYTVREKLMH